MGQLFVNSIGCSQRMAKLTGEGALTKEEEQENEVEYIGSMLPVDRQPFVARFANCLLLAPTFMHTLVEFITRSFNCT